MVQIPRFARDDSNSRRDCNSDVREWFTQLAAPVMRHILSKYDIHSYSLIAGIAISAALGAQSPTGTIVSANMTAGTASVVDIATGELRATYETGEGPRSRDLARRPMGGHLGVRQSQFHRPFAAGARSHRRRRPRSIEMGDLKRPHGMRFLPETASSSLRRGDAACCRCEFSQRHRRYDRVHRPAWNT